MALKSTIFKADLQIADMDRHHYQDHALTIARHPSETDRRMMARILAFALNADAGLGFTRGLSTDDEPDLWRRSLSDEIELWIDLGQPDEKRIRKACGRARQVKIYTYADRSARIWFGQMKEKLERFGNLQVIHFPEQAIDRLATLAQRNMQLQCTIQDGAVWIGNAEHSIPVEPETWK